MLGATLSNMDYSELIQHLDSNYDHKYINTIFDAENKPVKIALTIINGDVCVVGYGETLQKAYDDVEDKVKMASIIGI